MWESTIEKGILKLTFDEKRKKRKTRLEMLIPRATCAISRLGKEGQENIYLWPDTERTQKLLKSSGAVVTINSILSKMEALDASRDRISQHSRAGLYKLEFIQNKNIQPADVRGNKITTVNLQ